MTDCTSFVNPHRVRASKALTVTERRRFYDAHGISAGTTATVACAYCSTTAVVRRPQPHRMYSGYMQVDHVVPRVHGGSRGVDNLVWCCVACNLAKGSRTDWTSPNGLFVDGRFV